MSEYDVVLDNGVIVYQLLNPTGGRVLADGDTTWFKGVWSVSSTWSFLKGW